MGMEMVGVYVGVLRRARSLTQPELAEKIGVHERTIRNLEGGKHEAKPTDLAQVLTLLSGSWVHIAQLMQPTATRALAERLAKDVTEGKGFTEDQRVFLENLTQDQKEALLAVARQMQQ